MMTETHLNSNHMLNSGLSNKSEIDKMDDVGWKAKLKIPPKDKRIKTSVSFPFKRINSYYFSTFFSTFIYNILE